MRKKRLITYVVTSIVVILVTYFIITPALIGKFFPQYALMNKYVDAKLCTDLPEGAPSDIFLPARCNAVDKSRTVACTYESSRYSPPAQATDDEKALCPLFVTQNDNRGVKNVAIAMLPIQENDLRVGISGLFITIVTVGYIILKVFISRRKKR